MSINSNGSLVDKDQQGEGNDINIQKIIGILIAKRFLFIGSIIICCAIAGLYIRYATPQYEIKAKLLIKDDKKNAGLPDQDMLQDIGLLGGKSNVDNELEIVKTEILMEQVIKRLQLNVKCFFKGRIKLTELYKNKPFDFSFIHFNNDSLSATVTYNFKCNSKGFVIDDNKKNKQWQGAWGDTVALPLGKAIITKTGYKLNPDNEYSIVISNYQNVIDEYEKKLNAEIPNKQVSTIGLSLNEAIPAKGIDILNTFMNIYMQDNVEDKNRISDSTISFIDARLVIVGDELNGIEKQIEGFKRENKLADIDEQGKLLVNNTSDYIKDLNEQQIQLNIVSSLEDFVKTHNSSVVPSALMLKDATYSAAIEKYNELQLYRERLL
ncbi:MAG TPA: Wzz/FepE/Etk N-terminal domain-containing protein, partial [Candidatus Babeliaceae bacterium]|nr:Wzz/FepE/Etk N-terminal domain-containing protein [Candidatus Babeliaceae bacterium]